MNLLTIIIVTGSLFVEEEQSLLPQVILQIQTCTIENDIAGILIDDENNKVIKSEANLLVNEIKPRFSTPKQKSNKERPPI